MTEIMEFRNESDQNGKDTSNSHFKVISSRDLFGEDRTVVYIQHQENLYRLLKTRSGKLILNK